MRFPTSELAAHLGGELVGPDVSVDGASIDSRTLVAGQLYVPIVAERDGHAFVAGALDAGAPAYLTMQAPLGGTAIRVADTSVALMDLGVLARGRVGGVVGITGSVGKTTTKDLLRACLARSFPTAASERSFNNELGLPLTLLNAPDDAEWVVLEMGARGVGHIARLAQWPGPRSASSRASPWPTSSTSATSTAWPAPRASSSPRSPASGVAVLNFDDPRVAGMAPGSPCPVLGYAVDGDAEVRAVDVELDGELRPRFRLRTPWGTADVRLALRGAQQVPNALAARGRHCGAASPSTTPSPRWPG